MMGTASGTLTIAALAALSMALGAKAHADDYRRLSGAEIKRLIAGKVVTDEVHYTDHFRPGGVYEGVSMNKRSTGTWMVRGADLCIVRGSEAESCDEIWRSSEKLQRRKSGLSNVRDTIIVLPERHGGIPPKNKTTNKGD
jgi:hypothetical protein